jgi:hypothetical protein
MTGAPETEGPMTKNLGIETASLDAMTERHTVAQRAVADVLREWDERRAAGDVTSVVYAIALLMWRAKRKEARPSIEPFVPGDNPRSKAEVDLPGCVSFAARGSLKVQAMEAVIRTTERIS